MDFNVEESPCIRQCRTLPSWFSSVESSSSVTKAPVGSIVDPSIVVKVEGQETVEEANDNETAYLNSANFDSCDVSSFVNDIKPVISEPNHSSQHIDSSTSIPVTSSNAHPANNSVTRPSGDSPVPNRRPVCQYRRKCYRTNEQHKKDFSHIGDSDYDAQSDCDSNDAVVAKPRCWFGPNCYRKNEEHKQKFYHSPPSNNRKRITNQTRRAYSDDEYEGSFIDDNSSDDFLSDYDEELEAGFSEFDNYSSSDEDIAGPGNPKKKNFSIF